ncbi:hypothetical protein B0H11DRAFT_1921366 [Mycena galericulata]|nr:hypothetical protein B0H11DRAFT_1921366 [Mycena galericulata]
MTNCQSATKTVGFCSITPRRLRVISPPRRLGSCAPVPIAAITIWDPAAEESDGQWEGETADARELQAYSGSGEEGARLPRRGRHRGGSGATPIARNSARPEPLVRGGGVDGGPRREAKRMGRGSGTGRVVCVGSAGGNGDGACGDDEGEEEIEMKGGGGRGRAGKARMRDRGITSEYTPRAQTEEGGREGGGKEGSNMKEGGRERWSEGRMDAAAVEGIEMRREQGIEEEGRKGCADVRECRERERARNPDPARNSGEVGDGIGMQGGWVGWGCVRTRGGMGTECGGTVRWSDAARREGGGMGGDAGGRTGTGTARRGAAGRVRRKRKQMGGGSGREGAGHGHMGSGAPSDTTLKRNGGEEGEERGGTEAEADARAGGNGELGASVGVMSVAVPERLGGGDGGERRE